MGSRVSCLVFIYWNKPLTLNPHLEALVPKLLTLKLKPLTLNPQNVGRMPSNPNPLARPPKEKEPQA